jgi:hypothetical protein
MKHTRRRRPLRPRPSRAQVRQQIGRVQSTLQLFQLEWLAESQRPQPCIPRLCFLQQMIGYMGEEAASLEQWA